MADPRPTERRGGTMDRVTHRLTDEQIEGLDELAEAGVFANRSEAVREAVRRLLDEESPTDADSGCVDQRWSDVGHARADGGAPDSWGGR